MKKSKKVLFYSENIIDHYGTKKGKYMKKLLILSTLLLSIIPTQIYAQQTIRAVGSSTVYPFTTKIAEQFGKSSKFQTPVIESTGTGGGFKLFCNNTNIDSPSLISASRQIKKIEIDQCASNGINNPIEVTLGKDAIVIVGSKQSKPMSLSLKQVYLALAEKVVINNNLVDNPYIKWSDIDSSLPNIKIEVLGPPPTSGTRDSFVELAMEPGCHQYLKDIKSDIKDTKSLCSKIRQDGSYIEAGENDNLIIRKLQNSPNSYGVFGYSYYEENLNILNAVKVENVLPSFETTIDGSYVLSRNLYLYFKREHLVNSFVPGLKEFIVESMSEKAIGDDGYLINKGLIPLLKKDRESQRKKID